MGALFMQKLKEGNAMTDVHCDNKSCLNNRKGWCGANGIHLDARQQCKSYAKPRDVARHECAKVRRVDGKYRSRDTKIIR